MRRKGYRAEFGTPPFGTDDYVPSCFLRIAAMSVRLSSVADYETLLDKYDTWMFDCDGVLWHGDRLIDGAVDVLDLLRSRSMSFSGKATFIPHLDMWRREEGPLRHEQRHQIQEKLQGEI
jgi:hypothetical protein